MNSDIPLGMHLKGGRTYVHSTDMYPAALEALAERFPTVGLSRVQLVCRTLTSSELALTWDAPAVENRVAVFTFVADGERQRVFFVEREGEIREQVPYDEDAIAARGTLDREAKKLVFPPAPELDATLIEIVVASTKALHQALHPDAPGRWVVTQIESERALFRLPFRQLEIVLLHDANLRLTKSEIRLDGKKTGTIFFSLKQT